MKDQIKCYECEKVLDPKKNNITDNNNNDICESCKDDFFSFCNTCSKWFNSNNEGRYASDEMFCDDCFDAECFSCFDCEEGYNKNEEPYITTADGDNICSSCRDNYFHCSPCDEFSHIDYSCFCENCEITYCESCYRGHGCATTQDCDFTLKECSVKGRKIKIQRYIGLEIEAEDGKRDQLILPKGCGIEDDGSLDNGTEVTTPPRQMHEFEEVLHATTKSMRDSGFVIHDTCGLHVHLDATDFKTNYTKISNLFRTFYAIENVIYAMLPEKRKTNTYCKPLNHDYLFSTISRHKSPHEIDEAWYKHSPNKFSHHDHSRYHGLNLHSIFYRGTIEFRYHSGSLNELKILNWVNFLLHVTEYASKNYRYSEVLKLLKIHNNNRKFEYMMKIFKIDNKTANYLKTRIETNTPNFL